jgi:heme-degrading monooxygenase HmoA
MILEHALLPVRAGEEPEFEAAFQLAKPIISSSPGFRHLTLSRCLAKPTRYLLLVEWESLEDHAQGFRGSRKYEEWSRLRHRCYEPFPNVWHFSEISKA